MKKKEEKRANRYLEIDRRLAEEEKNDFGEKIYIE